MSLLWAIKIHHFPLTTSCH